MKLYDLFKRLEVGLPMGKFCLLLLFHREGFALSGLLLIDYKKQAIKLQMPVWEGISGEIRFYITIKVM